MKNSIEKKKEIEKGISYGITIEYFLLRNKELYGEKLKGLLDKEIEDVKDTDFDISCDKISFGKIPFITEISGTNEVVYINTIDFKGSLSGRKNNRISSLKVKCVIEVYWLDRIDVLDIRNRVYSPEDQENRIQEILAGSPKID